MLKLWVAWPPLFWQRQPALMLQLPRKSPLRPLSPFPEVPAWLASPWWGTDLGLPVRSVTSRPTRHRPGRRPGLFAFAPFMPPQMQFNVLTVLLCVGFCVLAKMIGKIMRRPGRPGRLSILRFFAACFHRTQTCRKAWRNQGPQPAPLSCIWMGKLLFGGDGCSWKIIANHLSWGCEFNEQQPLTDQFQPIFSPPGFWM